MAFSGRRIRSGVAAVLCTSLLLGLAACSRPASPPVPAGEPTEQKPPAEPLPKLVIKGPMSPPSILLARMAEQTDLSSHAQSVEFSAYKDPDQLRAEVTSGEIHVAAVPTYVAANLYRRGIPVQLLNVSVWGILHVMTTDPSIQTWDDLRGKTVFVPFKGDMPDLVFRYLASQHGLNPEKDMNLQYVSAPTEAMQMLLAGRAQAAVLHEPASTAAMVQGQQKGLKVRSVLDLQQEWGKVTGRAPRIPQAGTMIMGHLVKARPDLAAQLQSGLVSAAEWIAANPSAAAELGTAHLGGLKAPIIQKSLARTPIQVIPAAEAREELEFFFSRLLELSPDLIAGGLPDDGFYYSGR
ncbi:MAG: ABC transporter substrate-binding protein [Bacillota bacterium]